MAAMAAAVTESIPFTVGNPDVEQVEGRLVLALDSSPLMSCVSATTADAASPATWCIKSIPATITTRDLLHFLAPVQGVRHYRVVSSPTSDCHCYMVCVGGV